MSQSHLQPVFARRAPSGTAVVEVAFTDDDIRLSADHCVHGQSLASGALLLLKLRQCLGLDRDVFQLGKTVFLRSISGEEMRNAKFELRVSDAARQRIAVLQMLHEGVRTPILEAVLPDASPPIACVTPAANAEALDAGVFYAERARVGNDYGEGHRVLTQLGRCAEGTRGAFKSGIAAAAQLDGLFQLVMAAPSAADSAFKLASLDALSIMAGALDIAHGNCIWTNADGRPGSLAGTCSGLDAAGRAAVVAEGLRFAPAEPASVQAAAYDVPVIANFTADYFCQAWSAMARGLGLAAHPVDYRRQVQWLLANAGRRDETPAVLLLRLDELLVDASLGCAHAHAGDAHALLPNGLHVSQVNAYETDYLYREIFDDDVYLRMGIDIQPGDTIFDVGANIGMFSLFAASQAEGLRIHSFEPARAIAACLRRNTERCGRITVHEAGVGTAPGSAHFTYYPSSSVFSGFHADDEGDGRAIRQVIANQLRKAGIEQPSEAEIDRYMHDRVHGEVAETPIVSISQIIDEYGIGRINLLKVDAEKSEVPVLLGIRDEHWDLIDQVVMEVHDTSGDLGSSVRALLVARGFDVRNDDHEELQASGLSNLYAVKPARARSVAADRKADWLATQPQAQELLAALQTYAAAGGRKLVLQLCPLGDKAAKSRFMQRRWNDIRRSLQATLAGYDNIVVQAPASAPSDRAAPWPVDAGAVHQEADNPYSLECTADLAYAALRALCSALKSPHKVIVVDCDNTLWRGVCAEVGPRGVRVDAAAARLQDFLSAKKAQGFLLCMASKNSEQDVLAVFHDNDAMRLGLNDFAGWKIGWDAKSAGLSALAAELNLGIDSFVFIDDNPVECEEVRRNCPGVLTLLCPQDAEALDELLAHCWAFDTGEQSAEDHKRHAYYRAENSRREERKASASLRDYIASLDIRISVTPAAEADYARLSQLTARTNQFNLYKRQSGTGDIAGFARDKGYRVLSIFVSDRFGDYGLVGLALLRTAGEVCELEQFLLSCRILGREAEYGIIRRIAALAMQAGAQWLDLRYAVTARNIPAQRFLKVLAPDVELDRGEAGGVLRIAIGEILTREFDTSADSDDAQADYAEQPVASTAAASLRECIDRGLRDAVVTAAMVGTHSRPLEIVQRLWGGSAASPAQRADYSLLENSVATAWHKLLGHGYPDRNADFYAAGGSSLQFVQLVSSLNQQFRCRISLLESYSASTVAKLALLVQQHLVAEADDAEPRVHGDDIDPGTLFPHLLSYWFHFLMEPSSVLYNVPVVLEFDAGLDVERFRVCARRMLREPVFRTRYRQQGRDVRREEDGAAAVDWLEQDATLWTPAQVRACIEQQAFLPLDLQQGPLARATLLHTGRGLTALFVFHHLCLDLKGAAGFVQGLRALYDGVEPELVATRALELQLWNEHRRRLGRDEAFWKNQAALQTPPLVFPARFTAGADDRGARARTCKIAGASGLDFTSAANALGISGFLLGLALFAGYLARVTGQRVVTIGTPVALAAAETGSRLGCFTNLLPLRIEVDSSGGPEANVRNVREALFQAMEHRHFPYFRILRLNGGALKVQAIFNYFATHDDLPIEDIVAEKAQVQDFAFGATRARFRGVLQQKELVPLTVDLLQGEAYLGFNLKTAAGHFGADGFSAIREGFAATVADGLAALHTEAH